MKTRVKYIALLAIMLSGCSIPNYVPYSNGLGTNTHGSFITVWLNSGAKISGELIVADSSNLLILSPSRESRNTRLSTVPAVSVQRYKLQYARSKNYAWMLIPGILMPLIPFPDPDNPSQGMIFHGWFAIFTIPINLIAVGITYASGNKEFSYNSLNLSYSELRKFARYPQGLPEGIDLSSIN